MSSSIEQSEAAAAAAASGDAGSSLPPVTPELKAWIGHLAAIDRPSASAGEREAAEWIAGMLERFGCDARVEPELAHGGYWWPIGLLNVASAATGLLARRSWRRRTRVAATLVGAGAAATLWDDLGHGERRHRRLLPRRPTYNVVAEAGDRDARRTVVLIAHHDAAHSGFVFNPGFPRWAVRHFPATHGRAQQSVPIMLAVWLGPLFVALGGAIGSRRLIALGSALGLGTGVAMADIGARAVVPGANDNLSAVGALLAIARSLQERPIRGVRVLLVSTGSEESFSEGMQAFGRRHFHELDPDHTEMLCLECVGGPDLQVVEGEGMLRMRDYPEATRDEIARAAAEAGVPIARGLRTTAATDAIIALRAGYRVATLASVDETKWPANYHWPTDSVANLCWGTIEHAIRVCDRFVRRRADAAA
jgi:hypothetical protein